MPDFYLADEGATFIADNLDIPFTTEEMNRSIRTHHTEHPDFAKNIPSSFPCRGVDESPHHIIFD